MFLSLGWCDMNKIASPNELVSELQRILHNAQTRRPSRVLLARELADLGARVAADQPDAKAVLRKVEQKLKSQFSDLAFSLEREAGVGFVLTIEPKDRDVDSSVVTVSVDQDGESSAVSAHHYGSGHSSSEGPDFDGADVGKLVTEAAKLVKKYIARP